MPSNFLPVHENWNMLLYQFQMECGVSKCKLYQMPQQTWQYNLQTNQNTKYLVSSPSILSIIQQNSLWMLQYKEISPADRSKKGNCRMLLYKAVYTKTYLMAQLQVVCPVHPIHKQPTSLCQLTLTYYKKCGSRVFSYFLEAL